MLWIIIAPKLILAWVVSPWFAAWDTVNGIQEGKIEILILWNRLGIDDDIGFITELVRTLKGRFRKGGIAAGE